MDRFASTSKIDFQDTIEAKVDMSSYKLIKAHGNLVLI